MISVFLSFVTNPSPTVKMIGLGMAVAVFVDATIVRMMLVPATMELAGKWNWWIPPLARPDPAQHQRRRPRPRTTPRPPGPTARPAEPAEEPVSGLIDAPESGERRRRREPMTVATRPIAP